MKENSIMNKLIGLFAAIVLIGSAMVVGCDDKAKADGPPSNFHAVEWNLVGYNGEYVFHDDRRNVTCWVERWADAPAISCIPDSQLTSKP